MLFTRDTLDIQECTKDQKNKIIYTMHTQTKRQLFYVCYNTTGNTREKETFQNDKRANSTEKYEFKTIVYTTLEF